MGYQIPVIRVGGSGSGVPAGELYTVFQNEGLSADETCRRPVGSLCDSDFIS